MAALYQTQPYLRSGTATIFAAFEGDDGRFCVALRDSIFYPQGGGQKGDRGKLTSNDASYTVVDTVKDPFSSDAQPLCILEQAATALSEGQEIIMEIDWPHRFAQMRLHSIVHLHHCLMEEITGRSLPIPATSDLSSDGTGYNRYDAAFVTEALALEAHAKMRTLIDQGAAIRTSDDREKPGYRYWECMAFTVPCGGTHLADLREIGDFRMAFSQKKGKPKVAFELLGIEATASPIS